MKVSEVITLLSALREQHGDVEVLCPPNGYDHDYAAVCDGATFEPGEYPAIEFTYGPDWKPEFRKLVNDTLASTDERLTIGVVSFMCEACCRKRPREEHDGAVRVVFPNTGNSVVVSVCRECSAKGR